ncbi:MAG: YbaB/EbfC family nucleoid-associated protein [Gemmatimonadales bacterium]
MADLKQIFQLGQQMQGRLQELQADLGKRTIEASAGGGLVRITADGKGSVKSVHIDPAVFAEHDAEFLADLVQSAVSEIQRKAADLLQAEMKNVQPFPFNLPL